jgi:predicted RNA-binding protein Jag
VPIYVARSNSSSQIASALTSVFELRRGPEEDALDETREAIDAVATGARDEVELEPQNAYVRKMQHELVERANLSSRSSGHEPYRRVQIYR